MLDRVDPEAVDPEVDPGLVDLPIPLTTSGRSVQRSSEADEVAIGLDSPAKVESPRLWYIVGSLSHAGTLTVASAAERKTGVYGKEVAASTGGCPRGIRGVVEGRRWRPGRESSPFET